MFDDPNYKVKPVPTGWHVYVRDWWYFIPYWKRISLIPLPLRNAVSLIEMHIEAAREAQAKFNRL